MTPDKIYIATSTGQKFKLIARDKKGALTYQYCHTFTTNEQQVNRLLSLGSWVEEDKEQAA